MRVLIYAIDFAPKIGGEETILQLLGQALPDRMRRRATETASREANGAKADRDKWSLIIVTRTAPAVRRFSVSVPGSTSTEPASFMEFARRGGCRAAIWTGSFAASAGSIAPKARCYPASPLPFRVPQWAAPA